jgi:acyl-coenzyme A thioesterase PaaI-like protein
LTSESQVLEIDGERLAITPHNCFACGTLNAHRLRLDLHLERGRSWTTVRLDQRFEGWDGIAHGGIVTTILDEVMAWALVASDAWGMTARMNVEFRAPVPIDRTVRAEGELVEARRRIFRTSARLVDEATGALLASADGTYVAAPPERKRELQLQYGFEHLPTRPATVGRTRGGQRRTIVATEPR